MMNVFNSVTGFCTSTLYLAAPQLLLCSDTPKAMNCPVHTCYYHHFKVEAINEIAHSPYALTLVLTPLSPDDSFSPLFFWELSICTSPLRNFHCSPLLVIFQSNCACQSNEAMSAKRISDQQIQELSWNYCRFHTLQVELEKQCSTWGKSTLAETENLKIPGSAGKPKVTSSRCWGNEIAS